MPEYEEIKKPEVTRYKPSESQDTQKTSDMSSQKPNKSNMRSRWKKKGAGAQNAAKKPAIGEIENPADIRDSLIDNKPKREPRQDSPKPAQDRKPRQDAQDRGPRTPKLSENREKPEAKHRPSTGAAKPQSQRQPMHKRKEPSLGEKLKAFIAGLFGKETKKPEPKERSSRGGNRQGGQRRGQGQDRGQGRSQGNRGGQRRRPSGQNRTDKEGQPGGERRSRPRRRPSGPKPDAS